MSHAHVLDSADPAPTCPLLWFTRGSGPFAPCKPKIPRTCNFGNPTQLEALNSQTPQALAGTKPETQQPNPTALHDIKGSRLDKIVPLSKLPESPQILAKAQSPLPG